MSLGDGGLAVESLGGSEEDTSGAFTGDATPTLTVSVTAAAALGLIGSATKTLTVGTTAAGTRATSGAATPTLTFTRTAAGVRATAATATATLSLSVDADGEVTHGTTGAATKTLTISVSAAAALGVTGAATAALTLTRTAAAALGLTGTAAPVLTVSVDAQGVIPNEPTVVTTLTFTVEAAGEVTSNPQTLVNLTGGRRRAGTASLTWLQAAVTPPRTAPVVRNYMAAYHHAAVQPPVTKYAQLHTTLVRARAPRQVIRAEGIDISYLRGAPTPPLSWQLVEPGLWGPGRLTLPQIRPGWDEPGEGDLWFLAEGSRITEHLLYDDGHQEVTYRGFISDHNEDGPEWSATLGGHLTGEAALQDRQPPVYPRRRDIATLVLGTVRHNLRLDADGPDGGIGIDMADTGGMSQADWLNQTMATAQKKNGQRWTLMPDEHRVYQLRLKDTTTVHYTMYTDDARTVRHLRRDFTEEFTRFYLEAIREDGLRINGSVWPGLEVGDVRPRYPMDDHDATLSQGATDADTDTGDGVTVLLWRLWELGYIDIIDDVEGIPDDWDAIATRGLRQAQRKADITPADGVLTLETWRSLWDANNFTVSSLRGAKILPTAQDKRVDRWKRSATGQKLRKNPHYDPRVKRKDRTINIGGFYNWNETQDIADNLLDVAQGEPNWVGSLEPTMGALIIGEHTPGDPVTPDMLRPLRAVKPGENVLVRNLNPTAGGTLLHISGNDGSTLTVDSKARDTMEVWEIDARNRATRKSLRRMFREQSRSGASADSIQPWDKIGGRVSSRVTLPAGEWVAWPVVMGREGQVRNLVMQMQHQQCEWYLAVFGTRVHPRLMQQIIGNPSTDDGRRNWRRHKEKLKHLLLLYAAGTPQNPLGYDPSTKQDVKQDLPWRVTYPDGSHDIFETEARANKAAGKVDGSHVAQFGDPTDYATGRFRDDAGFSYFISPDTPGVGWCLAWAAQDTHLKPGRIWTPQLTDQL